LAIFIAKHINDKKRHYNFLKSIKRVMRFFFSHEHLRNFSGMFIQVSGKFQGILRKRKFQISTGYTSIQSVSRYVDYTMENSFTRFGVFSIKV
jgi:ribosomal protein S3